MSLVRSILHLHDRRATSATATSAKTICKRKSSVEIEKLIEFECLRMSRRKSKWTEEKTRKIDDQIKDSVDQKWNELANKKKKKERNESKENRRHAAVAQNRRWNRRNRKTLFAQEKEKSFSILFFFFCFFSLRPLCKWYSKCVIANDSFASLCFHSAKLFEFFVLYFYTFFSAHEQDEFPISIAVIQCQKWKIEQEKTIFSIKDARDSNEP